MTVENMSIRELELNIRATNTILNWKSDATIGDLRKAMDNPNSTLGGYLRKKDRSQIREVLSNVRDADPVAEDDSAEIIRNLLEHAVYDREKSDECIAAVEAAEMYLVRLR